MSCRYLAFVQPDAHTRAHAEQNSDFGLIRCHDDEALLLFVDDPRFCLAIGNRGAVIGELFDRGSTQAVRRLSDSDRKSIVVSNAAQLLTRYWGGWIAFLRNAERTKFRILRAPLGDLPCLHSRQRDQIVIASDLRLMRVAGVPAHKLDWTEILRHLAAPDMYLSRTCLIGIDELRGGDCIEVGDGTNSLSTLWSPWMFVADSGADASVIEAERRVRDAVNWAVAARSSRYRRILLRLSGGLDSSIVAAALSAAGRDFVALNMVSEDRAGDERQYARAMADAAGVQLVERRRSVDSIAPLHSLAGEQPRPATRLFMQDSICAAAHVAQHCSADIVFDGGGGDNVFCHIPSAAPVVDHWRTHGFGPGLAQTIRDVSALHAAPVSTVIWHTLRHAFARTPRTRREPNSALLTKEAQRSARGLLTHPWFNCPPGAYPGKARHVALLVSAQSWVEALDMHGPVRSISPLLSQPVVEACLPIASWQWFAGGMDRAVARNAFRAALPPAVANRAGKSAPDSFLAEIVECHHATIFEMLVGGRLVEAGIVDAHAVERALHNTRFLRGYDYLRILQLVDVEAWIRAMAP